MAPGQIFSDHIITLATIEKQIVSVMTICPALLVIELIAFIPDFLHHISKIVIDAICWRAVDWRAEADKIYKRCIDFILQFLLNQHSNEASYRVANDRVRVRSRFHDSRNGLGNEIGLVI